MWRPNSSFEDIPILMLSCINWGGYWRPLTSSWGVSGVFKLFLFTIFYLYSVTEYCIIDVWHLKYAINVNVKWFSDLLINDAWVSLDPSVFMFTLISPKIVRSNNNKNLSHRALSVDSLNGRSSDAIKKAPIEKNGQKFVLCPRGVVQILAT